MDVPAIQDNPIANHKLYTIALRQAMMDKMFFLDKIDPGPKTILDWGCADGALIEHMNGMFPEHTYSGYDTDDDMLTIAMAAVGDLPNVTLVPNLDQLPKIDVVVLSSVIHEIYSYGWKQVEDFWHVLFNTIEPEWIVIRDMSVAGSTSRPSDPLSVARIKQLFDAEKIGQWERQWGSLYENWSLVHFLLTYRFKKNWEREYRENYLPVSIEDMLGKIPVKYVPTYLEHFTLPFLREQVMKDFGIQLQDRTHLKLILKLT